MWLALIFLEDGKKQFSKPCEWKICSITLKQVWEKLFANEYRGLVNKWVFFFWYSSSFRPCMAGVRPVKVRFIEEVRLSAHFPATLLNEITGFENYLYAQCYLFIRKINAIRTWKLCVDCINGKHQTPTNFDRVGSVRDAVEAGLGDGACQDCGCGCAVSSLLIGGASNILKILILY